MQVDEGQKYSLPDLGDLERVLEAAIGKVRVEMDRKIGGQINGLECMVCCQLVSVLHHPLPELSGLEC